MVRLSSFLILTLISTASFSLSTLSKESKSDKIRYLRGEENLMVQLIHFNTDSTFELSIFPPNWKSCWDISSVYGKTKWQHDTLIFFIKKQCRNNNSSALSMDDECQEIFVSKNGKKFQRISPANVMLKTYHLKNSRNKIDSDFSTI